MRKKYFAVLSSAFLIPFSLYLASYKSDHQNNNAPNNKPVVKSAGLYLPNDLEATLWAESPMLYNPTNMDVDHKGRIWVTEAVNYRNYNNDSSKFLHHPKGDRVVILQDVDGDGKADRSTVFVQDEDLVSPLGIAVIGNKVIVACSPNMIIYTDENGDDKPDKKEVFLTGFGGLDHDHSLHAVVAGPDGKWYFNTGNSGPHKVTDKSGWTLRSGSLYVGGSPYAKQNQGNLKSDDGKIWVGGLALRINPDGTGLKVMGHNFRNSYESIIDSYGDLWQNDNDDQVVTCRTTWLMEGGNAGFFSTDGTRYWQADQRPGQDIFTAHWHQDDPGVMPAGDRSGAGAPTGITLYEGTALGPAYSGMLLSADAGRNVIFGYRPKMSASGFDLGKRTNLITSLSNDNEGYVWNDTAQNNDKEKWFRPSDVTVGTDGAIYVADWFDPVVGGHQMQDEKGYGRIYRITPKNKKLTTPVIQLQTVEGQIRALQNPAINVRNLGFQQLVLRGDAAVEPVKALLVHNNPYVQARAVWLLSQLGPNGIKVVEATLTHADPRLRSAAYRALRQTTTDVLPYARLLVNDTSAFVRREVAISLRDWPYEQKKPLLLSLAQQTSGTDRWYIEALGASLQGNEPDFYAEVKPLLGGNKPAHQWSKPMTAIAWRLHPKEALPDLVARAKAPKLPADERRAALTAIAFINQKAAADSMISLAQHQLPDVAEQATYWLAFRQGNDWYSWVDNSKLSIKTHYARKLARMQVKRQIILDERQSLPERRSRVNEMAADSVGGQLLIGLAAEKKIPAVLLPFVQQKIFQNPDAAVRVQAGNYFNRPGSGKVYAIPSIAKLNASSGNGKALFSTFCSSCHRLGNQGNAIGPELTGIGKKFDRTALLDAIVNPSAAIVFGYEPYLVNTKDGGSLFGFLVSENNNTLVIKDVAGQQHVLPVANIIRKQRQEKSLMPDPDAMGLTPQNLADIVGYLQQAAVNAKPTSEKATSQKQKGAFR